MDAQEVADAFDLGRASSLSEPVARGELGEIRRLETDRGAWAVKQGFEPAEDDDDPEHGATFQLACWEAGVPSPRPVGTPEGRFSVEVAGEQVRVYTWVDLADPDTGLDPAAVGELLARMHAVRLEDDGPVDEWFEAPIGEREWKGVLKASRAAGAPYADRPRCSPTCSRSRRSSRPCDPCRSATSTSGPTTSAARPRASCA